MAEIKLRGITKRFGDYQALESIDLTISDQEFMVLLGASGCGKTTLLRIIAGLETPDSGEVIIGDRRVDGLPARSRGISMVFQNYAIFPHMTVFDNIGFGLKMSKLPSDEISRRVHRTSELMHIDGLLDRYSGELSGGQRQRVAVARALAMEPDVILMDEPLSNLDALLRLEMRAELKNVLAQSRTTAIYVTHDQVEAMSLADRISVMHGGLILQSATPLDVYRNPSHRFVASFIGNPPMNFLVAENSGSGVWSVGDAKLSGPNNSSHKRLELSVRPEDVVLCDSPDSSDLSSSSDSSTDSLLMTVEVVEPLGAHLLVTCRCNGSSFRATLPSDSLVSVGDEIRLRPLTDRIRWFDSSTELRVD